MKTFYLSLITICLLLISCNEEDGIARDSIKLSENHVEFGCEPSKKLITKNFNWAIISIKENGVDVNFGDKVHPKDYKLDYEGGWYRIKRDNKDLIISVIENSTNSQRQLDINLQAGNWYGSKISIEQKGGN
jgi:hypothetical protein